MCVCVCVCVCPHTCISICTYMNTRHVKSLADAKCIRYCLVFVLCTLQYWDIPVIGALSQGHSGVHVIVYQPAEGRVLDQLQ